MTDNPTGLASTTTDVSLRTSKYPVHGGDVKAAFKVSNALMCSVVHRNGVSFFVKSRRGAVMVAKFAMYWLLQFAIPERLRTSCTVVGVDTFCRSTTRWGSGRVPSAEKIWPKNSSVGPRSLHLLALRVRPQFAKRCRHLSRF